MANLLATAKIAHDRPGPLLMADGREFRSPIYKDAEGCFVVYKCERVGMQYLLSKRQWQPA